MNAKEKAKKRFLDLMLENPNAYYTDFKHFEMYLTKYCTQLCKEQRELVADELKRYSEDLSIPNQYKINDLCMDAPMPEL